MGVSMERGSTRWVRDPVTINFGTVAAITSVKSLHSLDPSIHPTVLDINEPAQLIADSSNPLWRGQVEIATRIGPRGDVTLAAGDWQRIVCITTADEDLIEKTGTVTIL